MLHPYTVRIPALLLLASLAAAPALGLGYGEPVPPGEYCPEYAIDHGAGDARVQLSTSSPIAATVVTAGEFYFVEDTFYVNSLGQPYMFSLWIYQESNGMAGLQRGDEVCSNTPPGFWADTIANW